MFRAELVWCQAIISKIARWFSVRIRIHHFGIQEHEDILVEYNSISFDVRVRFSLFGVQWAADGFSENKRNQFIHTCTHKDTCIYM